MAILQDMVLARLYQQKALGKGMYYKSSIVEVNIQAIFMWSVKRCFGSIWWTL